MTEKEAIVETLLKDIVEWCSDNGQAQSQFLYPRPEGFVYTFPLFDFLSTHCNVPKEKIGEWFNARQELNER